MNSSNTNPPKIVRPPNRIRQKIGPGAEVKDLLKPERVQEAQQLIDIKQDDFLVWAKEDLEVLTQLLQPIQRQPATTVQLEEIVMVAEKLRDRGGTFGYQLLSLVAKSLVNYCGTIKTPTLNDSIIISKHIEGIYTILNRKISGDGGFIGTELLEGLKQLITKLQSQA